MSGKYNHTNNQEMHIECIVPVNMYGPMQFHGEYMKHALSMCNLCSSGTSESPLLLVTRGFTVLLFFSEITETHFVLLICILYCFMILYRVIYYMFNVILICLLLFYP